VGVVKKVVALSLECVCVYIYVSDEGGSWAEKKFSSYPFGENAVPKLLARFVTESRRETRSA